MTKADSTRERLIETYRRKARHYDLVSRLSPVPGYPEHAQRVRAVRALNLHAGDAVVEIACGTGANFGMIEDAIGPSGHLVGVDLTDAMLERAQVRVEAHGWGNVRLVQMDAAAFPFPERADAILSTYALTQVPDCGSVIAHGAAALSAGGRWVVLDLKLPEHAPGWLSHLGVAVVGTSASLDQWMARRPWETIRAAMQDALPECSWTELCFGTAFLAAGSSSALIRR
ncbi:class I SAM-dependent methyltransferase [Microbacterium sp. ASV49]|uniref:Methyltransferase domain-containing protein n=1 Tax=Microbacterium candidum TaxID=3041922 RepID=A0ABT7N2N1_9MICO|nr:methyltransferase domain-containing protein [Microbacterium sp. ASV49]MDL9980974.1 methyltransferase domain-containing protein [Microbacterium sp. ASV49]